MAGISFATQLEAVKYLNDYGYKVGKSKFNQDFKAGRVATGADGGFEKAALLGYAAQHCTTSERLEDRAGSEANLERLKADAENKKAMAARNRLKLEREMGNLISRDLHEEELGARAAFFRREIETFGPRLGSRLIALVGGDESRLEDFIRLWAEETEIWMDAWAADRAFVVPLDVVGDDETAAAEDPARAADAEDAELLADGDDEDL